MDVFEAVRTLLAVRRYQDRSVPEPVVRKILEAGRLTGSAANKQPWHFVVVEDRETLRRLGETMPRNAPYVGQAPLAEMMRYKATLDSVTGGTGSYTMEFSHYEQVPGNIQAQIIKTAKVAADEEE